MCRWRRLFIRCGWDRAFIRIDFKRRFGFRAGVSLVGMGDPDSGLAALKQMVYEETGSDNQKDQYTETGDNA